MKKRYSVLILFTIFLEILLLTGCGQNNDEDNLRKKILAEVEYLDSTITSILNRMNHISFQNYTVSIKQVNEEESSETAVHTSPSTLTCPGSSNEIGFVTIPIFPTTE